MNIKVYLSALLREMGISHKYIGYIYLEEIVFFAFENRLYLKSLSRYVYPEIANQYETSPKSVEKAVDNVIRKTFEKGGLCSLCGGECPSNKEVITFFVNKLTEYCYKWGNSSKVSYR